MALEFPILLGQSWRLPGTAVNIAVSASLGLTFIPAWPS